MLLISRLILRNHDNHYTSANLEFIPMTEIPIVTNYTFFAVFAFSKINSFG